MEQLTPKVRSVNELSEKLLILANPNRLSIIVYLKAGEMTVGALADALGLGQSALSQHLMKMKKTGLVQSRKDGQLRYYSLTEALTKCLVGRSVMNELMKHRDR
ncbi:ArsR/SmtB family transcription factor [Brucella intermedia]|uniref:ArsR/SmtB family transcription factor n=1 Tax=Brucella intermedia TaxID=94625 RepID=UPI002248FC43|nr:metalloregulator ArsR/SmtB family transcription factor [Brucella intermedia]